MYHKVGFVAARDAAKIWKDDKKGRRILSEPEQFVWRNPPDDAEIVKEPYS
jgi:hypothetical protein